MQETEYAIQLGDEVRFKLKLRDDLFTHNIIASYIKQSTSYEPEVTAAMFNILKLGSSFIDVGAHIGWFTLIASRLVGEQGCVFAFEPDRDNFSRLLDHLRLNDCSNVIPIHSAVSETSGVKTFHINSDNDGGHALYDPGTHPFNGRTRVEQKCIPVMAMALDSTLLPIQGHFDLLKIDTEGAELHVLRGSKSLLERQAIKHVIAEVNKHGLEQMGSTESELIGFMKGFGYSHTTLDKFEGSESVYNILFSHDLRGQLPCR